jgi:hypothetical protein
MTAKFATEAIYWQAQRNDQWRGGEYPGAHPKYSGTSVLEVMKVLRERGHLDAFYWAFGLEDLVRAISWIGQPCSGCIGGRAWSRFTVAATFT